MACPDDLTPGFSGMPVILRRAICHLWVEYGTTGLGEKIVRTGTGLLFRNISKGAWVVTAGHMLFHHDHGLFAKHISLKFGRDGDSFFCPIEMRGVRGSTIFVTDDFVAAAEPIAEQDYGMIRVAGLANDIPTIALETMETPNAFPYTLIGYPHEKGRCNSRFAAFNTPITVNTIRQDNVGYVNQETYGGMSGGPLLAKTGPKPDDITAFGLHIRGARDLNGNPHTERAIRFNDENLQQLRDWLP